jgi:hypothetical protein
LGVFKLLDQAAKKSLGSRTTDWMHTIMVQLRHKLGAWLAHGDDNGERLMPIGQCEAQDGQRCLFGALYRLYINTTKFLV